MRFSQKKVVAIPVVSSNNLDTVDGFIRDQLKYFFTGSFVSSENYNKLKTYIVANDLKVIEIASEKYLQKVKNKNIDSYLDFLDTYLRNKKNFEQKYASFIPSMGSEKIAKMLGFDF